MEELFFIFLKNFRLLSVYAAHEKKVSKYDVLFALLLAEIGMRAIVCYGKIHHHVIAFCPLLRAL